MSLADEHRDEYIAKYGSTGPRKMTPAKDWNFDEKEFNVLMGRWLQGVSTEDIRDFIQSACEAHADKRVREFAEEIISGLQTFQNDKRTFEIIDAALKRRGIS
jgi:hypothetical protein